MNMSCLVLSVVIIYTLAGSFEFYGTQPDSYCLVPRLMVYRPGGVYAARIEGVEIKITFYGSK